MADIFLSYSARDANRIKPLVGALEQQGWSVWWDYKIRIGSKFDQVIEEELSKAKCVMVVWSNESVKSDWVKNEAYEGQKRDALAPVLIDNVAIPLGFRSIEAAKLYDWKGKLNHPELKLLLNGVAEIIGHTRKPEEITEKSKGGFSVFGSHRSIFAGSVVLLALVVLGLLIWYLPTRRNPSPVANNITSPLPSSSKEDENRNTRIVHLTKDESNKNYVLGIDISHSNGDIDWFKVDKNFVSFALIKATEGAKFTDPNFKQNWTNLKRVQMIRGAYHFFVASEDARQQADHFARTVKLESNDLPPILVVDSVNGDSVDDVTLVAGVKTWLQAVNQITGRKPIIMTGAFWNGHMTDEFGDYPLWVMKYPIESNQWNKDDSGKLVPNKMLPKKEISKDALPKGWGQWSLWQFSDHFSIDGLGMVNATLFNGSYDELKEFIEGH